MWEALAYGVASAAVAAASSSYNANQANRVAEARDYNASYINIVSQLQNQDYNAHQAALSREFNSREAGVAREFNADQAGMNRAFQAQQSSTSYQRAVADMKAAGLNPMLAYSQGGASTPAGSSANINSAQAVNASAGGGKPSEVGQTFQAAPMNLGQSVSSTVDLMKLKSVIENINADTDLKEAATDETTKKARNLDDVQASIRAQIEQVKEQTIGQTVQNRGYAWDNRIKEVTEDLKVLETETAKIDQRLKLAQISQTEAQTAYTKIGTRLDQLKEKAAENQEAIDKTTWGEKGRPILDDIGKVTGSARGISGILNSRGR